MNTIVLVRRFLADYVRNPVNLLVLILVPVVFVAVAATSLADAARLLGGREETFAFETVTAGWAAAFVAAVAMYFQISGARHVDRRLVISGLPVARLVLARLIAGMVLAALASAAALATLAMRFGIDDPARVIAGTAMFAVIYLGLGAVAGALIRSPVNGMVTILFIWIVDIFFEPTISAADKVITRPLPTHFTSLWMIDLPSRHGGRPGDLGWSLAWTVGAAVLAFLAVWATSRIARRAHRFVSPGSALDQLRATVTAGVRDWRRNASLWFMLAAIPAVYVLLSDVITPHRMTPLPVREAGQRVVEMWDIADIHGGTMAPIAVASLAALVGLFAAADTRTGDQRLAQAGMRSGVLLAARLSIVMLGALVAATASLAFTAVVFDARQWGAYIGANLLIAVIYGMVGVVIAPVFGKVAGVFIAFLIPFLDIGLAQSPMLRGEPAAWAQWLPGYGPGRILIDAALTDSFDETRSLIIAGGWLAVLLVAAAWLFRRSTTVHNRANQAH